MNYQEAVEFIENLPKFSPAAVVSGKESYDLTSMNTLLEILGNPHKKLKFVHIAGTNGKGSTAAFIQKILMESGLAAGLYTSPALERFTERIRIGSDEISEMDLVRITGIVKQAYEEMDRKGYRCPSQYEVVCAAAMFYFAEQRCDIVVLEVGMGGTCDATNVIDVPELAVITTISLDHTAILGDTEAKIAEAKAGIIKENGMVLLYPQQKEVEAVIEQACRVCSAQLYYASLPHTASSNGLEGQTFELMELGLKDLYITMLGSYQIYNAAMAVNAAMLLQKRGWPITEAAIRSGLASAVWPGRFEILQRSPIVVADGGHNEEGVTALRKSLEDHFKDRKIIFITGVLADKNYQAMMDTLLPIAERFYTVTPDNPRALPAEKLAGYIRDQHVAAMVCSTVETALSEAIKSTGSDGIICVTGSLYYMGNVRRFINNSRKKML